MTVRACRIPSRLMPPPAEFDSLLARCAGLGFNVLSLPCPFADDDQRPMRIGDIDRLAPWFARASDGDEALTALAALAKQARGHGMSVVLDVRLDEMAGDAGIVRAQPAWFRALRAADAALPDPRHVPTTASIARARFDDPAYGAALADWWRDTLSQWGDAGIGGFRCLWPQRVPSEHWRSIIAGLQGRDRPQFWAWTPGAKPDAQRALAACGFDAAFASLPWWDFRSDWYFDEDERLGAFPAVLVPVDDPDAMRDDAREGDESRQRRRMRALAFAAATSDGVLVALDALDDAQWQQALVDANAALARGAPATHRPMQPLSSDMPGAARAMLLQTRRGAGARGQSRSGGGKTAASKARVAKRTPSKHTAGTAPGDRIILVNADTDRVAPVDAGRLIARAGAHARLVPLPPTAGDAIGPDDALALEPAEVRVYAAEPADTVTLDAPGPPARDAASRTRIAIESVEPSVDGGRFPVKRLVGERVSVSADVFGDGHDRIAAAVLWRATGERTWQRAPMRQIGNDRWCGEFALTRLGRHEFTVEAWRDAFATAHSDVDKKRMAGNLAAVDVREICALIEATAAASRDAELRTIAAEILATDDEARRVSRILDADTAQAMARASASGSQRPFLARHPTVFAVDAERKAAGFASWYELFPRSQAEPDADGTQRHGTFDDVIARLPAIREMGFDVLYMPPIHPIGLKNRKGRNNSVTAEPGEPGSPYAIGAEEGGHDAIHPQLGTLDDFRRLVSAAAEHGLELALDFAIQCAPDHPWLREHPDWFAWRADGSIRYAENPPKKYQDIVNVDFYAEGAIPGLWLALRDAVAFWVNEGVRLFRVDNPHTKPFPFWEWLIGDIRGAHPDVVFLSEAFTRPKVMYRLAKLGYSQSYTYFTWRNGKAELTEYLQELADGPPRDFFRPHFFVNTPDINPVFLQTSGRAGHLIRAALATTLSGLWGMYQGFELCEATPLPGKEEYLDSEKYQLRHWDWSRPGNITAEIAKLNRLRRLHPALQTHLGVHFYNAFHDHILCYGKRCGPRDDMILVLVNLDPHSAHEADFELPLWEWGLPDHDALEVEDLWRGTRELRRGKLQRIRLDPGELPFAIWRIGPQRKETA